MDAHPHAREASVFPSLFVNKSVDRASISFSLRAYACQYAKYGFYIFIHSVTSGQMLIRKFTETQLQYTFISDDTREKKKKKRREETKRNYTVTHTLCRMFIAFPAAHAPPRILNSSSTWHAIHFAAEFIKATMTFERERKKNREHRGRRRRGINFVKTCYSA